MCEWSGAEEPLKGQTIPVDFAVIEIVSDYREVHYEVNLQDSISNPALDIDD